MGLKTWRNGEKANNVQEIIEHNFKLLGKHLRHNILSLSSAERNLLSSDYISDKALVFDTDDEEFYQYNLQKGIWEIYPIRSVYVENFSSNDWVNNSITIPYSLHRIPNPITQLFILNNDSYEDVVGGISIDYNHNVIISSDMAFDGKVVLK